MQSHQRLPCVACGTVIVAALLVVAVATNDGYQGNKDMCANDSADCEVLLPEAAAATLEQQEANCVGDDCTWLLQMGASVRTGSSREAEPPGVRLARQDGLGNYMRRKLPPTVKAELELDAESEVKKVAAFVVLPGTVIIMLSFLCSRLCSSSKKMSFVPEALCTVLVAVILGFALRYCIYMGWISGVEIEVVDSTSLNLLMLPIIIFNGGWSIDHTMFKEQFVHIQIFALLGTLLTMVIIAASSLGLAHLGFHHMTSIRANIAFAALISSTDPVATLATFGKLQVARWQPLLYILVSAESLLNDAVAIAVFDSVNKVDFSEFHWTFVIHMTMYFFLSIFLGFAVSAFLVVLKRSANLEGDRILEVLFVLVSPFLIFALAECLDLSGIIADLFAGMTFRIYGAQHLTMKEEETATEFFEIVAHFMETLVFVLCGTSAALIRSVEGFRFGLIAVGLCLVSRVVAIAFCVTSSNAIKKLSGEPEKALIDSKQAFIIWLGGLRGGVALVLCLMIDTGWCGVKTKSELVSATFFIICVLLLFCGGATEICLKTFNMVPNDEHSDVVEKGRGAIHTASLPSEKDDHAHGSWLHLALESILVGSAAKERRRKEERSRSTQFSSSTG